MRKRVLVVEDNKLNSKLFCDLLELQNCDVITESDGSKVIDVVTKNSPDLILMDIQLNDISGTDIIKSLKSNSLTLKIPIIAITAFAMKNDEKKILSSGCDMYLSKPISIDTFFKAIKSFIGTDTNFTMKQNVKS